MALEKITVIDRYTPPGIEPEVLDIWIDFSVGEDSLSGDDEFVEMLKYQVEYMPKEPCKRAFRIDAPVVARWTAQPFNNRDDFKVLLFVLNRYIEGDREIDWVESNKPYVPHFTYSGDSVGKQHDRDDDLMVAEERFEYNAKGAKE